MGLTHARPLLILSANRRVRTSALLGELRSLGERATRRETCMNSRTVTSFTLVAFLCCILVPAPAWASTDEETGSSWGHILTGALGAVLGGVVGYMSLGMFGSVAGVFLGHLVATKIHDWISPKEPIRNTVDWVKDRASDTKDFVVDTFDGPTEFMVDHLRDTKDFLADKGHDGLWAMRDAGSWTVDHLRDTGGWIVDHTKDAASWTWDGVKNVADWTGDRFRDAGDWIGDRVDSVRDRFASAPMSSNLVETGAPQAPGSSSDDLTSLRSNFLEAAKGLQKALIDGSEGEKSEARATYEAAQQAYYNAKAQALQ